MEGENDEIVQLSKELSVKDIKSALKGMDSLPTGFSKLNREDLIKSLQDGINKRDLSLNTIKKKIEQMKKTKLINSLVKLDWILLEEIAQKADIDPESIKNERQSEVKRKIGIKLHKDDSGTLYSEIRSLINRDAGKQKGKTQKKDAQNKNIDNNQITKLTNLVTDLRDKQVITHNKLEAIANKSKEDLKDLNEKLDKIISTEDVILNKMKDIEKQNELKDMEKLLLAIHEEGAHIPKITANSLNQLKCKINEKGIDDSTILWNGMATIILMQLMDVIHKIDWDIDLELFYQVVTDVFQENVNSLGSADIPDIRRNVCKRINLSKEKFDEALLQCKEKNWVQLDIGTPIGIKEPEWLDTGKSRFYYLRLKRKDL